MRLDIPDAVILQESSYDKLKSLVDANGWGPQENLQAIGTMFGRAGSVHITET
jgi:hypothetical protein